MLNNFEKFSFPSIEKRWTKDKETDRKKEKKKKRKKEKMKKRKNEKKKKKKKKRKKKKFYTTLSLYKPSICSQVVLSWNFRAEKGGES